MNINKKVRFYSVFLTLLWISNVYALPSYRRLWEKKYGYKMSCVLCHQKGGGSELTDYSHDFQRFGMTPGAFTAIENRDSDGDGNTNIEEIQSKSNPGDKQSTVNNPTDWLDHIEKSMLPTEQLKKLFPGTEKFSSLEGTLLSKQIAKVEKKLGRKLPVEDTVPTFYFAVKKIGSKFKRIGVALFVTPQGDKKDIIVSIGMDLTGKITKINLVKNKRNIKLSDEKFLSQFSGKSLKSPFKIGAEIKPVANLKKLSALISDAVYKGLLIINSVFSQNK